MTGLADDILSTYHRVLARADEFFRSKGWYAVARKDYQDTIRSRWFVGLSLVFIVIFAVPTLLELDVTSGNTSQTYDTASELAVGLLSGIASILIPLVGIVVGYAGITRERESGTLKLLLSQPNSRYDVVLGKFIGRSAAVAVPILIGFVVTALVIIPSGVTLDLPAFTAVAILTAFLGVVFVGLAIGISAGIGTSFRSVVTSVGLFVYLTFFWTSAANTISQQLVNHLGITESTRWNIVVALKLLNPTQAYKSLAAGVTHTPGMARMEIFADENFQSVCETVLGGDARPLLVDGQLLFECSNVPLLPLYYTYPAIILYMLFWLAIPLLLGYWVFVEADL